MLIAKTINSDELISKLNYIKCKLYLHDYSQFPLKQKLLESVLLLLQSNKLLFASSIKSEISQIYLNENKPDSAYKYALDAIQLKQYQQQKWEIGDDYLTVGKLELQQNNFDKSIEYLNEAIYCFDSQSYDWVKATYYLAEANRNLGNYNLSVIFTMM